MSERMSPSEAIMWAVEKDPTLRSDFCNITILDRPPDQARVRAKITAALAAIPRLGERVVSAPLRIAPPEWRADPTFDLDYHLRKVALPAPGTQRALLDLVATLCGPPLDRSRPLWEFTLVEGLEGGRAAMVQRVHHTVTDGEGGLRLSLSLVDLERAPEATPVDPALEAIRREVAATREDDPVARDSPLDVARGALGFAAAHGLDLAGRGVLAGGDLLLHPQRAPQRAFDAWHTASSARRQLLVADPSRSPLLATRSLARRYDTTSISLEGVKAAARALGGTVNDVYVTGVTGALGRYHERMGEPVDDLRMAMAISTRRAGDASGANQFVPTRVVVPVGPKEPTVRFALVRDCITELRADPALSAADAFAALAAGLPTAVLVGLVRSQARTVDFATSNLRGSPVDLYLGGSRIEASYPMGPRSGCAVNFTVLSYRGALDIGIHSDPAAVTDPGSLVGCLDESFAELLAVTDRG
jgi:WS/DGAT/MGAT family acyltransferase